MYVRYYKATIPAGADVLDLCSSWVSHYPTDLPMGRVVGVGMNDAELRRNPQASVARGCHAHLFACSHRMGQDDRNKTRALMRAMCQLSSFVVQDLNRETKLPFDDASFDVARR